MAISTRDRILGLVLRLHQTVYVATDGRVGASLAGRPMLLLHTVGARTGQQRTAALLYLRDGDDYGVVASKGGDDRNPGWYHNLLAHPQAEIQVGRERITIEASVAEGQVRRRMWETADRINQGQYTQYQNATARVIPVLRLRPVQPERD